MEGSRIVASVLVVTLLLFASVTSAGKPATFTVSGASVNISLLKLLYSHDDKEQPQPSALLEVRETFTLNKSGPIEGELNFALPVLSATQNGKVLDMEINAEGKQLEWRMRETVNDSADVEKVLIKVLEGGYFPIAIEIRYTLQKEWIGGKIPEDLNIVPLYFLPDTIWSIRYAEIQEIFFHSAHELVDTSATFLNQSSLNITMCVNTDGVKLLGDIFQIPGEAESQDGASSYHQMACQSKFRAVENTCLTCTVALSNTETSVVKHRLFNSPDVTNDAPEYCLRVFFDEYKLGVCARDQCHPVTYVFYVIFLQYPWIAYAFFYLLSLTAVQSHKTHLLKRTDSTTAILSSVTQVFVLFTMVATYVIADTCYRYTFGTCFTYFNSTIRSFDTFSAIIEFLLDVVLIHYPCFILLFFLKPYHDFSAFGRDLLTNKGDKTTKLDIQLDNLESEDKRLGTSSPIVALSPANALRQTRIMLLLMAATREFSVVLSVVLLLSSVAVGLTPLKTVIMYSVILTCVLLLKTVLSFITDCLKTFSAQRL